MTELAEPVGLISAYFPHLDVPAEGPYAPRRRSNVEEAMFQAANEIRHAAAGLDPARESIVYCQTGRRSSAAAFLLSQRGLHVHLLEGGLKALLASGAGNSNKGMT